MKKFIGVLLTVVLCACLTVPVAFASAEEEVAGGIADLIGGIVSGDGSLDSLDLGSFDIGGIVGSFIEEEEANEQIDAQVKVEQALQDAKDKVTASTGMDLSWLTTILGEDVDAEVVNEVFADFDSAEMPDLLTLIANAFSGAGIDMTTFSVSELGNFDIAKLLGGADSDATFTGTATEVVPSDMASNATDLMTGIIDTLKGGLGSLGIDTDALLGSMSDSKLINFFANMYIGFVGSVEDESSTTATTTTTAQPETGDTASAVIAVATLLTATAAAGVCLKKKED